MTVVLRPRAAWGPLSLAAGVAVARALRGLYGLPAELKWPNDVLVGGLKVSGVLVEARAEAGGLSYALLGVGVNVNNELPPEVEGAASVRGLLGRAVPRGPLLLRLLAELDRVYSGLEREPRGVLGEWRALSATLGRRVLVATEDGLVEGLAVDVTDDGALVVESGGARTVIYSGEVVRARVEG